LKHLILVVHGNKTNLNLNYDKWFRASGLFEYDLMFVELAPHKNKVDASELVTVMFERRPMFVVAEETVAPIFSTIYKESFVEIPSLSKLYFSDMHKEIVSDIKSQLDMVLYELENLDYIAEREDKRTEIFNELQESFVN
jgi:hypothetical protein